MKYIAIILFAACMTASAGQYALKWNTPATSLKVLSYGVYVNGFIRKTVTMQTTFVSAVPPTTFYVRANYKQGTSVPSNIITLTK